MRFSTVSCNLTALNLNRLVMQLYVKIPVRFCLWNKCNSKDVISVTLHLRNVILTHFEFYEQ